MKPTYLFLLLLLLGCSAGHSPPRTDEGSSKADSPKEEFSGETPSDFYQALEKGHRKRGSQRLGLSIDTTELDSTAHFRVFGHGEIPKGKAQQYMAEVEGNFAQLTRWVGKSSPLAQPFQYHFYPSCEVKGLLLKDTRQSHINFEEKAVHTVLNPAFEGNRLGKENKLLLRYLLGKPAFTVFEDGLWGKFAPGWQKEGTDYWMYGLVQSELAFPLKKLLDSRLYRESSPLIRVAAADAVVEFLVEYWGKPAFLMRYNSWNPSEEELARLQPLWEEYLQRLPAPKPKPPTTPDTTIYYRGFNFAHEGYRIYNGYGSDLSRQSLDRLRGIGANALAIVPYSYMGDPRKPTPLRYIEGAGGETDESVARTAYDAKQRGMHTLLKPQIWFGQNAWPGEVMMESEEDWQAFFQYYGEWIRHYALLAEIYEVDMLCLGVEFSKATLARPDNWRRLAKEVRAVFRGGLTYAANWGSEVEGFVLWDSFDCIGVNCYYPLSDQDIVSDQDLERGFRATIEHLDSLLSPYQKPILFTEIGFRSVEKAWQNPHASANGRAVSHSSQARCYRVVGKVLEETGFGKGVFWWKWPSYLEYAERNPDSFSPSGQEAEKVVEEWFSRMK